MTPEPHDVLIVGGGAAAWSAAIYARRYALKTVLVEEQFGGETASAGMIENYPGFDRIDGFDLMNRMRAQATALGVQTVEGKAALVENRYHCFRITVGQNDVLSKTIILATGMEHRTLGLPHEDGLKGKGVHYCATCDGPLFKKKRVAVVGGGDSAVKWANQLADMGVEHVYVIVREKNLNRAEPINRTRLEGRSEVTVSFENEVVALVGSDRLASVTLAKPVEGSTALSVAAVFVAIGSVPRSDLPVQLGVRLDSRGQIMVDPRTMHTNVDGVFAAGDVTDAAGSFKQIVTSASQGAIAATAAYEDVIQHPNVCTIHGLAPAGLLPAHAAKQVRRKTTTRRLRKK